MFTPGVFNPDTAPKFSKARQTEMLRKAVIVRLRKEGHGGRSRGQNRVLLSASGGELSAVEAS